MIGLYIHIPFCKKRCHYCNFVVTTAQRVSAHVEFLTALGKEMAFYREAVKERCFDTLYLGGGTPSTLPIDEISRVFRLVHQNFKIQKDAEITCEVNPGDIDLKKADTYQDLGIQRISVGVQSFNQDTLRCLNRDHGVDEIFQSFEILKKAGFKNISLDLMLSLPGETLQDVRHSLRQAVGLKPQHISLYELTVEERTVFGRQSQRGKLDLPDEAVQVAMLSEARTYLKEQGYRHYELLSYAREGFESRHNRVYWANEEYLGLGPAAYSYLGGRRFRRSRTVDEYFQKIKNNDKSMAEEEHLNPEKKEVESFLLALRLNDGAERRRFSDLLDRSKDLIKSLKEKGLIEENAGNIRLTDHGQFFAETVFAELSQP